MASPHPVNLIVEGNVDEAIVGRVVQHAGLGVQRVYGKSGKGSILRDLGRYNQAARLTPWLVVVDLDREPDCAPLLIDQVLPDPAPYMRFRVAVRAVEAWLLADAERLARFLGIPVTRVPREPEAVDNPKIALVNLARHTRYASIREDMVPREGSGAQVGLGYVGRIIDFAVRDWRPDVAAGRSDSLRRCISALQTLK